MLNRVHLFNPRVKTFALTCNRGRRRGSVIQFLKGQLHVAYLNCLYFKNWKQLIENSSKKSKPTKMAMIKAWMSWINRSGNVCVCPRSKTSITLKLLVNDIEMKFGRV